MEAQLRHLDERSDAPFAELRSEVLAELQAAEARWERCFGQLTTRLWWLFGFQFTILLALVAVLTRACAL